MRSRIKHIFSNHYAGILLALFFGVSILLPHLLLHQNSAYQGIELMGQDAEEHYIARVNEIYRGDYKLGNTFLPNKNEPYLQPPLGEIIQAWVGKALFLNAPLGVLAGKFIFPFLCALAIYALAFLLTRSRLASVLGTTFAFTGFQLMSGLSAWKDLLKGVLVPGAYTIFSRPINPQVSSFIMFVALAILYRAFFIKQKMHWAEALAAGLLIGASLYMNPYTFSFMGLLVALIFAWYCIKKDWPLARAAFMAGSVGLFSSIPFFINYLALHHSADFAALAARQGLVADRHAVLSIWLLVMLVLSVLPWPKAHAKAKFFFLLSTLSLIILTYQNVLTGYTLQSSHYHWYITKPLFSLMLGLYGAHVLYLLFHGQRYVRIALAGAALLLLCYASPLFHIRWYLAHPDPTAIAVQNYAPVMSAINTLPSPQVVWADPMLSQYISIYTQADAPGNPFAAYYLNPQSFYEDTLFLHYRFAGERPDTILVALARERSDVSLWIDGLYWRQTKGNLADIPDAELTSLAEKYKAFYARSYGDVFKELGITVVVAPLSARSTYDSMKELKLFAAAGDYILYSATN